MTADFHCFLFAEAGLDHVRQRSAASDREKERCQFALVPHAVFHDLSQSATRLSVVLDEERAFGIRKRDRHLELRLSCRHRSAGNALSCSLRGLARQFDALALKVDLLQANVSGSLPLRAPVQGASDPGS